MNIKINDPFVRKSKTRRPLFLQLLFVVLAFALMVVSTGIFVNNMLMSNLRKDAEALLTQTQVRIEADLREPQTLLLQIASEVRDILLAGGGREDVVAYYYKADARLRDKTEGFIFDGFQGYFWMFDEMYIPAPGWDPPDDFDPTQRPWYSTAMDSYGDVLVSPIYQSARSLDYQITYLCRIFDDENGKLLGLDEDGNPKPLGIVVMNMPPHNIIDYVIDMRLTDGGYGWLTDENYNMVAHPNPDRLNMYMGDISVGLNSVVELLKQGSQNIAEHEDENYKHVDSVFFCKQMDNGWSLGLVTPRNEYYRDYTALLLFLSVLGVAMMMAVCFILIRIDMAKNKADQRYLENRERLAAMESMREADERTQIMLDATPLCIHFWDKNNKIIDCNEEALKLFGISDKRALLDGFFDYSPEYQPNGELSRDQASVLIPKALEKGRYIIEWMHKNANGELIPCEVTMIRVKYKDDYVIAAYARDLREVKAAIAEKQKAIEEKNALVNVGNVLNGIDAMIYVTDPDTDEILFINDNMQKHYAFSENSVGQTCYKILQKDMDARCDFCPCYRLDRDSDEAIVWEEQSPVTGRTYRNIDRYIEWPNGKRVHLQHSVDITEMKNILIETEKLRNQAETANKAKSVFLANMSHEIRTPMNAILGITEIQLRDETLPPAMEEGLSKVYESGNLLLNIVNDILDLSKIEAGKLELVLTQYDIPSLINDTIQVNRMRYESKSIEFYLDIDENTPLNLLGDELRIKQILGNILSNAFKYTDSGEVKLEVWADDKDQGLGNREQKTKEAALSSSIPYILTPNPSENDINIVFRISDTGQGMTQEQLDTLFDEYTRFNMEANRTTIGTGLGMSITRRLLDLMDGEVLVESEVDKGSVFTVRIPQKRVDALICGSDMADKLRSFRFQSMSIAKKSRILREYMPYGSILIVDDVESNIYVARGMLSPYGLNIESVSSGFEAIEKIKNGCVYDIIFMDHMMPKMDGIEATKIIRGMGYTQAIIALTANALVGQAEKFLHEGFDGFVSKPIDSRELNFTLNNFIRNKKSPEVVKTARREQREKVNEGMSAPARAISEVEKFFVMDAESAVGVLEEINTKFTHGKTRSLDEADITAYEITVHGMKSALNNIREKTLSDFAYELEQAAANRNFDVISDKTEAFIGELKSLIQKYKALTENGGRNK